MPIPNSLALPEPAFTVGWEHVLLRTPWPWVMGQYDSWKLMGLMGSLSLCNRRFVQRQNVFVGAALLCSQLL